MSPARGPALTLGPSVRLNIEQVEVLTESASILDGFFGVADGAPGSSRCLACGEEFADTHYNLGNALSGQGKHVEAEAAYRKAIALKPDLAEPHCNLGNALRGQGRFTESLAAYRRGHELGSKQAGWRYYPSLQWVREA